MGKQSRALAPVVSAERWWERLAAPREVPWHPHVAQASREGWAKGERERKAVN